MGSRLSSLLPDDPKSVIDIAQTAGNIKGKVVPGQAPKGLLGRYNSLADDVGAIGGVMTAATGAGLNKAFGSNSVGNKLKQVGTDIVLNPNQVGRGLINTPLAIGGAAGVGYLGGKALQNVGEPIPPELIVEGDEAQTALNWLNYKNQQ